MLNVVRITHLKKKNKFLNYPHYYTMIAEYTPINFIIKFGM